MLDIYRALQQHWRIQRDPVYLAERRRGQRSIAVPAVRAVWQRHGQRIALVGLAVLTLISCQTGVAGAVVVVTLVALSLLVGVAVVPYLWRIPAVVLCAPLIVREREGRTWEALATIPASMREILLAKMSAALQPLQGLVGYVVVVRLLVSLPALAAGSYFLLRALGYLNLETLAVGLLPFCCAAYYLLEPYQDVAIDGAVGLVASTFSPSVAYAFPLAIILRLALWLVQLLALIPALGLLTLLGLEPHLLGQLPLLALLGPGLGYLTDWPFWAILLWMAMLLPVRLLWLNGLFALAERRARENA